MEYLIHSTNYNLSEKFATQDDINANKFLYDEIVEVYSSFFIFQKQRQHNSKNIECFCNEDNPIQITATQYILNNINLLKGLTNKNCTRNEYHRHNFKHINITMNLNNQYDYGILDIFTVDVLINFNHYKYSSNFVLDNDINLLTYKCKNINKFYCKRKRKRKIINKNILY